MASGAVERYLLEFNEALVAGAQRRERILAEVEEHLRDATQSLLAAGRSADEAQVEAVARFGSPVEAATRFGSDPIGRGQQASRWYEGRQIAHPVLVPTLLYLPWIAFGAWWASPVSTWPFVLILAWQIHNNIRARRAIGSSALPGRLSAPAERLRLAMAGRWWLARTLAGIAAGAYIVASWFTLTSWLQAIAGYYLACGLVAHWARPSCCDDPSCRERRNRWAPRPAAAAISLRYAAWALALGGPLLLPKVLPVAASHTGMALFALAMFLAFSPLPTRSFGRWLCDRRPAVQVVIRTVPLLGALAFGAVREPVMWMLLPIVAAGAAYVAATHEVWYSRWRSDATRRQLLDRARGLADDADGSVAGR